MRWTLPISDPTRPLRELLRRPRATALVLAPPVLATLVACIITQKFTWLYLVPLVVALVPGAMVTHSLREGKIEDNWGVFERKKAPLGYWLGVGCWSVFYFLSLALVIVLAYQLEIHGEIPMRGLEGK